MGTVGMSLAILAPQQGYAGYNFYQYHTFCFFLIHAMGVALTAAVLILGIYEPKYKDIFKFLTLLLITQLLHIW